MDERKPLVILTSDILTAFDAIVHETMDLAFEAKGVDLSTRIALLKQVSSKWARLRITCAGLTQVFPFQRGGLRGGVNTPEVFNMILQTFLADIISFWEMLD